MSVVAIVTVTQWSEARLAGLPIDARPWLAHLVARLRAAAAVTEVVVACHPECLDLVTPHVPEGTACVATSDVWAWAAAARGSARVAVVPVWQLFVDPARLDRLAALQAPAETCVVRATLDREPEIALAGGAFVDVWTPRGVAAMAAGHDVSSGVVAVPVWPEPPELRVRGVAEAGWGATLQRALLSGGRAEAADVDDAFVATGLSRCDVWRDGAGRGPRRILTVRCLPAPLFDWLCAHLARLPGAEIDVVTPAALAEGTASRPGVRRVLPFAGASFALDALDAETLRAVRDERYDLCVVPRRTPCGRGFENVTPLALASGAAVAVWMDVTGTTGMLDGQPFGWEPWITEAPPWQQAASLRARAAEALRRFTGVAAVAAPTTPLAETAAAIVTAMVTRMDEHLTCRALVDAVDHGLDLAPSFVHQWPDVAAVRADVAEVDGAGRSVARLLRTTVDRALVASVTRLAALPPGAAAEEATAAARTFMAAVAAQAARVRHAAAGSAEESAGLVALDTLVATVDAAGEGVQ